MIRMTRFRMAAVIVVVLGALFLDAYAVVYRYLVVHQPFPQALTSTPNIGGHDVSLHKGLDLQGGTELVIAICRGDNNPPGVGCRQGPPGNGSISDVQNATITILQQRVNTLGVSEAIVQAQGSDQILVQLPGIGLQQAVQTVGTTAKLHFATPKAGAPNPADPSFIADQQNLYDPKQFNDTRSYPAAYHWLIDNNIDASDVTSADVGTDQSGQPAVNINFNGHGAAEWSKITSAAQQAAQGSPQNRLAILLDNAIQFSSTTEG